MRRCCAAAATLAALLLGLVLVFIAQRGGATLSAITAMALIAIAVGGSWAGFHEARLLLDPILPASAVLAVFAIFLGFLGTPAWPWFQSFLGGGEAEFHLAELTEGAGLMIASIVIVSCGVGLGWMIYGARPRGTAGHDVVDEAAAAPAWRVGPGGGAGQGADPRRAALGERG